MIWTRAPAFGLKPSTGRFEAFGGPALTHQGAQPSCCNFDAVRKTATEQMPQPGKVLAEHQSFTDGSSVGLSPFTDELFVGWPGG